MKKLYFLFKIKLANAVQPHGFTTDSQLIL